MKDITILWIHPADAIKKGVSEREDVLEKLTKDNYRLDQFHIRDGEIYGNEFENLRAIFIRGKVIAQMNYENLLHFRSYLNNTYPDTFFVIDSINDDYLEQGVVKGFATLSHEDTEACLAKLFDINDSFGELVPIHSEYQKQMENLQKDEVDEEVENETQNVEEKKKRKNINTIVAVAVGLAIVTLLYFCL